MELFNRETKERMLGQALAECGDVDAFWAVIEDEDSSFYTGVSKWQLALDPLLQFLVNGL